MHTTERRKIPFCVISDTHLGTFGCHAKELNYYLASILPEVLVINGDFIDIWNFNKRFWPKSHNAVLQQIFELLKLGTTVYYITGNHDEYLRKYSNFTIGNLHILDQLELEINGEKVWFVHGDFFDICMKYSKFLAKLGGVGYDILIFINRVMNNFLHFFGKKKLSLSKKVKDSIKSAIKFIQDYEKTMAETALEKGCSTIVCGHIHQPEIKFIQTKNNQIQYINSGDWVENLTAVEYDGSWKIFQYHLSYTDKKREQINIA